MPAHDHPDRWCTAWSAGSRTHQHDDVFGIFCPCGFNDSILTLGPFRKAIEMLLHNVGSRVVERVRRLASLEEDVRILG